MMWSWAVLLTVQLASLESVRGYMRYFEGLTRLDGFRPQTETLWGQGRRGARFNHQVNVQPAAEYLIAAFGDNNCEDLDLRVYDERGKLLGEDLGADPYPMVRFQGAGGRRMRVEVIMSHCEKERCFYGIRVFGRGMR